jgi:hypothetical protein
MINAAACFALAFLLAPYAPWTLLIFLPLAVMFITAP